jgi:hypothetical protein
LDNVIGQSKMNKSLLLVLLVALLFSVSLGRQTESVDDKTLENATLVGLEEEEEPLSTLHDSEVLSTLHDTEVLGKGSKGFKPETLHPKFEEKYLRLKKKINRVNHQAKRLRKISNIYRAHKITKGKNISKLVSKYYKKLATKHHRKISRKVSKKLFRKISRKISRKQYRKIARKISRKFSRKIARKVAIKHK